MTPERFTHLSSKSISKHCNSINNWKYENTREGECILIYCFSPKFVLSFFIQPTFLSTTGGCVLQSSSWGVTKNIFAFSIHFLRARALLSSTLSLRANLLHIDSDSSRWVSKYFFLSSLFFESLCFLNKTNTFSHSSPFIYIKTYRAPEYVLPKCFSLQHQ